MRKSLVCLALAAAAACSTPASAADLSKAKVLYYSDAWTYRDVYTDAFAQLGIVPTVENDATDLKTLLDTKTWDLVVYVRNGTTSGCSTTAQSSLIKYINAGGRIIGTDYCNAIGLLEAFDVQVDGGEIRYLLTTVPFPIWDGVPFANYVSEASYREFHFLKALGSARALAQFEDRRPAVVLGSNGKTLYNSVRGDDFDDLELAVKIASQQVEYLLGADPGPTTIGGVINNLDVTALKCTNSTTGQTVTLPLSSAFDCEAGGLVVKPGEKVQLTIKGFAQ